MMFLDIPGQERTKKSLINQVRSGQIPHSQILLAKPGGGGLALALAFASYLLCKNRTEEDSCGSCPACNKSHKFIHPDIHFCFPVVKYGDQKREIVTSDTWLKEWRVAISENPYLDVSRWMEYMGNEDTKPNINVKEINDIKHKLGLTPYESDTKLLLLWMPEYLEKEGNRLLKIIEEPTDNTYIIMVAENQDLILQTILSRCRITTVPPFVPAELVQYLTMKYEDLSVDYATQISNLSQGNLNLAIQLYDGEEVEYSEKLIDWFRYAYTSHPEQINEWLLEILKLSKDDQKNFLLYGLHFLRQYIFWLTTNQKVPLTDFEMQTAKKMVKIIDIPKAYKISKIIDDTVYHLDRNANARIHLFADTLEIGRILRNG
jgi:DNA polymerase-3 subunit delta'